MLELHWLAALLAFFIGCFRFFDFIIAIQFGVAPVVNVIDHGVDHDLFPGAIAHFEGVDANPRGYIICNAVEAPTEIGRIEGVFYPIKSAGFPIRFRVVETVFQGARIDDVLPCPGFRQPELNRKFTNVCRFIDKNTAKY